MLKNGKLSLNGAWARTTCDDAINRLSVACREIRHGKEGTEFKLPQRVITLYKLQSSPSSG
jgi:hypothetical protein